MHPVFDSLIPLYTYCEKAAGIVPQPLNFLSCIVFWLGAAWMYHTRAEDDESPSFHQVSAILLFLLGLSGMAWHVSAEPLAFAADMVLVFMLLIIIAVVVCNDVLRWDLRRGTSCVIGLIILSALLRSESIGILPQNGGLFLPILFFLAVAALKIQTKSEEVTAYLLSAAYTLFFGLLFRSADPLVCAWIPQGLHFLWHIFLVASVIYVGKTIAAMKTVPWPESQGGETEKAGDADSETIQYS